MTTVSVNTFEVQKSSLANTRYITTDMSTDLVENEVILQVDKFALTANNISYGVAGDTLGYWNFFPSTQGWGRIPAMGYSQVIASRCKNVSVGERVWGFVPMASHVKIIAGNVTDTSFSDISVNRLGLSPVYASFERVTQNPFYQENNEDFDLLVRGLFTTAWLIEDFMFDQGYFGAEQYIVTSASSKTSIALAFAIKARGDKVVLGITSNSNKAFVEDLGCYDQVVSYEQVSTLDNNIASILVDMAGSQTTLATIHSHFAKQLRYSCRVGVTHHDDLVPNELTHKSTFIGVEPIFFFAPTQLKKRINDWGTAKTMNKIFSSLHDYIELLRTIIVVKHARGEQAINMIYQNVLLGKADASVGHIITL